MQAASLTCKLTWRQGLYTGSIWSKLHCKSEQAVSLAISIVF